MASENFAMGIFLFSQITLGIFGNSSILVYYVIKIVTGKHLMPKDLIIEHLTFANCLSIISRGIPQTLSDYGFEGLLDDIGCKLVVYISHVTRVMSLYMMCLLSCFQAVTISSSISRWIKLKHRATKYIGPSCSVSWLVHLLLNMLTPTIVSGPGYDKNVTNRVVYGYCLWLSWNTVAITLYMFLLFFFDGLCLGLMSCSSVYMLHMLYRHKRQVKHIHSAQHFLKVSPEDRATQTILLLLCTFVISYTFSSIVVIVRTCSKYPVLWGVNVFTFIEICFPIFCPFVLITHMKSSSSLFFSCFSKR